MECEYLETERIANLLHVPDMIALWLVDQSTWGPFKARQVPNAGIWVCDHEASLTCPLFATLRVP